MLKILPTMHKGLLLQCLLLIRYTAMTITITKDNAAGAEFSARSIGRSLAQCFGSEEKLKCFQMQLVNALDAAAQDNTTWYYNDFILFEKRTLNDNETLEWQKRSAKLKEATMMETPRDDFGHVARSFGDAIGEKLLSLAETRSIRLQLPPPTVTYAHLDTGISNAIDDITSPSGANAVIQHIYDSSEEGTVRVLNGLVDDKIEAISTGLKTKSKKKTKTKKKKTKTKIKKRRKKKDKDKGGAMMGGMAMIAVVAQMFLGKVILIAGAAFVMAKIALLISLLGSLKKGSSGSSGSSPEHVIVTSDSGHSHGGGWHRSMPHDYAKIVAASHEHHAVEYSPSVTHSVESHSSPHISISAEEKPKHSHYNYEITEHDDEEFRRRQATGFL